MQGMQKVLVSMLKKHLAYRIESYFTTSKILDYHYQSVYIYTVGCCYNAINCVTNINKRHPIARPLGWWDMRSFVDPEFDWYSASVPVIIYVISWNTGLRYNGIQLYKQHCYQNVFHTYWYDQYAWSPSIQPATIDHHGHCIYSEHYTIFVSCCEKTFYCKDS